MPDLGDDTTTTTAVRVRVTGRVQGVFFRDSTRRTARSHDVAGWVRNDPGGTVTAVLEGSERGVEAVLDWIRRGGPPAASVRDVDVTPVTPEGHDGFTIRH